MSEQLLADIDTTSTALDILDQQVIAQGGRYRAFGSGTRVRVVEAIDADYQPIGYAEGQHIEDAIQGLSGSLGRYSETLSLGWGAEDFSSPLDQAVSNYRLDVRPSDDGRVIARIQDGSVVAGRIGRGMTSLEAIQSVVESYWADPNFVGTALSRELAGNLHVFYMLSKDGDGQELDQGVGNYYRTDPVEKRNFDIFLKLARERGNSILDVACGDGVEAEVLVEEGFDVTGFDLSPSMVEQTARRLAALGKTATLYIDSITGMRMDRYPNDFAGVMFAQAACFVPVVDQEDSLMNKVISDLASTSENGAFYYSTTWYDDPRHVRQWGAGDDKVGSTILHFHEMDKVAEMITDTGLKIVHTEQFDAGPGKYKNDYIIAVRD